MKGYHYDVNDQDAVAILQNQKSGSYILTSYSPYNDIGHFTTYTKVVVQDIAYILKDLKFKIILPEELRLNVGYKCHGGDTSSFHNDHIEHKCILENYLVTPISRRQPL